MRYLIIDDEPIAHQIIERFCQDLPFMSLAGNCYDAIEALEFLRRQTVDLLFLDIQMPKLAGFDLLRTLDHPPLVIVISAHKQYALEGYDLNVCDYLLKPFHFERFLKAVNKARANVRGAEVPGEPEAHETLFLKDGKKYHQVRLDDIALVEAQGNYSLVHTKGGNILTQEKISDLAVRLPGVFVRVHKSFIVAARKIELIEGDEISIGRKRIPIGRVYKPNVARLLDKGES